ncbi:uncharacterized protein LOC132311254 isoform X2 [Cornus florida]|uniref:uncharacterized protein LOC132311254 isoform X2 n=1 Tax=Cornus florida TaxID=4283 RepID=UPI0028A09C7C|nr:uncharacterized protein LOC132311254 isoform X2 [Cornus florida]
MITMEFKGITWVGNIYQKFEAMCLEVEEVICQDTVKYVEDQVQMVGASVKMFYSDVMHDLLPPSSIDPMKVATADLSLNPNADIGISKKPKASIKEEDIMVEKQVTEYSKVIVGVDVDRSSSFSDLGDLNHFPAPSSRGFVKGACSDYISGQNNNRGICENSDMGIKMTKSVSPVSKDLSRALSCYEISEKHKAACDQIAMISPRASDEVTGCGIGEGRKVHNSTVETTSLIVDASIDFPMSDMILSDESCGKKDKKIRCSYSDGTCTDCEFVPGSYITRDAHYNQSAGEEFFTCHTGTLGGCNMDVIENSVIVEPGIETIEQFDTSKIEETCVLVDRDKLYFVSHGDGKHRTYKIKIQEALSSKMRLTRKQEYEQLALQHGDVDAGLNQENVESSVPTVTTDADAENLAAHVFCESEWELL